MKIVFLGSPEFAVVCLKKLLATEHQIVGIVSQPDRPVGRGGKLTPTPVKQFALANNLPVYTFEKISRDGLETLRELKPDIMVTAAYGQILSKQVLEIPHYGTINVHASLLPKYRGASPIQSAIINGEAVTGITIMHTDIGLDDGDILAQRQVEILPQDTAGTLGERLSVVGSELLVETLKDIASGTTQPIKQNAPEATYTTKLSRSDCIINWNKSAKQIKNLIMGSNPDPIASTMLGGNVVKIYTASIVSKEDNPVLWQTLEQNTDAVAGEILKGSSPKTGVFVLCGNRVLKLGNVQLPGGKVLPAESLLAGRKLNVGDIFENKFGTEN